MSDQEIGKKMCERNELEYFINAYEFITGEKLTILSQGEKPDFICERKDGYGIGIELTKVVRSPESALRVKILNEQEFMSRSFILDRIYSIASSKDHKRNKDNWQDSILVIQLMDCPLSEIINLVEQKLQKDFISFGFSEIWLADYTGLDAYGDIELFGLYPEKWWGYHQRNNPDRKPYG